MSTRGRKKRARSPGAGSSVKIKTHTRSPRGPNKGKSLVRVDGYRRGKPSTSNKKRRSARGRRAK